MTEFSADDLTRHAASLRRLARDLLGDHDLADDAVQQTFVRALTHTGGAGASLPGWLRSVLRSCAIDIRRRDARRQRREQVHAAPSQPAPATGESIALQHDILVSVGALDEPYRTVVWQRYYEDLEPAAIALRLGVPVKTVKTRLWRALRLLRQKLDRDYGRERWTFVLLPCAGFPMAPAIAAAPAAGVLLMTAKQFALVSITVLCVLAGALAWPRTAANDAQYATAVAEVATATPPAAGTPSVAADRELLAAAGAADHGLLTTTSSRNGPYGALDVQVRWHDGAPAADVAITCRADNEPQLDRSDTRFVSNAQGLVHAEPLHAGKVHLTADRGGALDAEVAAGVTNTIEFVLAKGIDVDGTVVDALERPVANARVVLVSGSRGWLGGRPVATTIGDGSFHVRAVDAACSLGADAAGHGPAELVDLDDVARPADAERVTVRLQLGRLGAGLAGVVLDEDGTAIAGAMVFAGKGGSSHLDSMRRRREEWSGAATATSADGSFHCEGLEPGRTPLVVRAANFATHFDTVLCPAGETTQFTVRLQRGTTVLGTVRDERGMPIADAVIRMLPADLAEKDALLAVSYSNRDAVPRPHTRSDAAGNFELHNLPDGDAHLLATMRSSPTVMPACRTTLPCAGGTLRWDPVLSTGLSIRVRIVGPDGRPMLGHVIARTEDMTIEAEPRYATIPEQDEFHTFTIAGCADADYSVVASVDTDERQFSTAKNGVRPGGQVVVMQLPALTPDQPAGTVQGRIVDAGQRLRGKATLVRLHTMLTGRSLELRDDRFRSDDLQPGRYCVVLQTAGDPVFVSPWFELHAAEHLDLGDLITEAGAELVVTLRTPDGSAIDDVSGRIGDHYNSQSLRWDGHALQSDNVTPGHRELELHAEHWFAAPRSIDIVAGRRNELTIDVLPAAPCKLELELPLPGKWQHIDVRVRNARGEAITSYEGNADNPMWSLHWPANLPFGQFEYEAVVDGVRHAWPIDRRDPATREQPLRFSLR